MVKIEPKTRFDYNFKKVNKELVKALKSIRSELKHKIKRLDITIDLLSHDGTIEKGYDLLIKEIQDELSAEYK